MGHYETTSKEVFAFLGALQKVSPEVGKGFMDLHKAATTGGALGTKHKELIAVALSVTAHCEGCLSVHMKSALDAGASREEVMDAIGVAILMGGGPALYAAKLAHDVLNEYTG
ncbi:MAG: carboxymuconolactone decarboxylase family protein [Candidatus Marinimicrobia bacterium]|nr:carboxymuconolactone decarboxylase family protein [Candidatus Neomarinimicrobiota bacterium]